MTIFLHRVRDTPRRLHNRFSWKEFMVLFQKRRHTHVYILLRVQFLVGKILNKELLSCEFCLVLLLQTISVIIFVISRNNYESGGNAVNTRTGRQERKKSGRDQGCCYTARIITKTFIVHCVFSKVLLGISRTWQKARSFALLYRDLHMFLRFVFSARVRARVPLSVFNCDEWTLRSWF